MSLIITLGSISLSYSSNVKESLMSEERNRSYASINSREEVSDLEIGGGAGDLEITNKILKSRIQAHLGPDYMGVRTQYSQTNK